LQFVHVTEHLLVKALAALKDCPFAPQDGQENVPMKVMGTSRQRLPPLQQHLDVDTLP
jgi:hypothetical protein